MERHMLVVVEGTLVKKRVEIRGYTATILELVLALLLLLYQDLVEAGKLRIHIAYHRGEVVGREREYVESMSSHERLATALEFIARIVEERDVEDSGLLSLLVHVYPARRRGVEWLCRRLAGNTVVRRYSCKEDRELHDAILRELRRNLPDEYGDTIANDWGKWLLHTLIATCKRRDSYSDVVIISHDRRLIESVERVSSSLLPRLLSNYGCGHLAKARFRGVHARLVEGERSLEELLLSLCEGLVEGY